VAVTSAFPGEAPTGEDDWIGLVATAPELALATGPVLVVAPHPDDETLAIGGLLAELRSRDVAVHVLAVTDGEASHAGDPDVARLRRLEQVAAMRELGIDQLPERLGMPDSAVAAHVDELRRVIEARARPGTVVLAPWEHDGHTDHDACGLAARQAADGSGAALLSYPVWAWQWAEIADLEVLDLRRTTLGVDARAAKARALACYPSQTTEEADPAILSAATLVRFARPWEAVIDAR
jgi:LmbE family N-acetylglucosaminyl deacetylase